MCNFKSGIIFINRVVIAEGENDSHSDLLESLGIEDTTENAMRMFVRAELLPGSKRMEESSRFFAPTWWSDPRTWRFHVDQDILPDWFTEDQDKYKEMFIVAVEDWCKEHVLVGKEIKELSHGYYLLKNSKVEILSGNVLVDLVNSKVVAMLDKSSIKSMCGNSGVGTMYDNTRIENMCGNARVEEMCDNSSIESMSEYSRVETMCYKARIGTMRDDSRVEDMHGNSRVGAIYGNSGIEDMHNDTSVRTMWDDASVENMWDNTSVKSMGDDSSVRNMWGNARVEIMYNNACIGTMSRNASVGTTCNGY